MSLYLPPNAQPNFLLKNNRLQQYSLPGAAQKPRSDRGIHLSRIQFKNQPNSEGQPQILPVQPDQKALPVRPAHQQNPLMRQKLHSLWQLVVQNQDGGQDHEF